MGRKRRYLKIALEGEVFEDHPGASLVSPRRRIWFRDLVDLLRAARTHPRVDCVWVVVKDAGLSWSQIEELHLELDRLHEANKETVVFLEQAGNREYYLAAGFQKIFLAPLTGLQLLGLRGELLFFSEALERAGIQPEAVQVGRYKAAAEVFTRTGFSEAAREMLDSILSDLQGRMVDRICRRRSVEPETVTNWVDEGPYTSREALEGGMVDGVCYEDELDEKLTEDGKRGKISPSKVLRRPGLVRRLATFWRPQIAYVVVEGIIRSGHSSRTPGRGSAGSDSIRTALKKVRESRRVAAVVLRINSPGGSAAASDLIWREVALTNREKPVIVSMGAEAASGGYYIAVGGRCIFALPATLTGSIGVIGGKFNVARLLKTLGIRSESIDKASRAGLFSVTRAFGPEEESRVRALSEDVYRGFLDRVATGRDLPPERAEELAQGRVWTGNQAAGNGLVDALGGLEQAIDKACEETGLRRRKVRIVHYRERRGLRDWLPLPVLQSLANTQVWALSPFRWKIF